MFESITSAITAVIRQNNNWVGLGILAGCALLEYVFPPFPGDTVTLFGSFLVVRHDWSLVLVFASVMGGSAVGAMIDYFIGYRLGSSYRQGKVFRRERVRQRVERVLAAFRRYGPAYVAINRFLPGVRAVIFVAAGMAQLKPGRVLLFALISAALWNAAILALGYAIGANWEQIRRVVELYANGIYLILVMVAAFLALRWWMGRRAM